jgi:hypothetical protein
MHLPGAIVAPAYRTSDPPKIKSFLIPARVILWALRAPAFRSFCAAGHFDTLPIDECISNLFAGFMEIAPCGLTRDTEFLCRLFLFEPFEVDEPDQLDLLGLERDPLPFQFRAAAGLVAAGL